MSFWHTFVGKAIHHATGGVVGVGSHYNPHVNTVASANSFSNPIPTECYNDLTYWTTHIAACSSVTAPTMSTDPTVPTGPTIPTIPVGGNPTDPVITPVDEPSTGLMLITALILMAVTRSYYRYKNM